MPRLTFSIRFRLAVGAPRPKPNPERLTTLDGKLLRIIEDDMANPIFHMFNLSLLESVCLQSWRQEKVIPLTQNIAQYYIELWLHGTLFHIRLLMQAVKSDLKNR